VIVFPLTLHSDSSGCWITDKTSRVIVDLITNLEIAKLVARALTEKNEREKASANN